MNAFTSYCNEISAARLAQRAARNAKRETTILKDYNVRDQGNTAFGLDLSASSKLSSAVSYRLSGTLSHDEIDASNLGFAGNRGLLSGSGKASFDVKLSRADLAQISATMNGRRLTPQGYRLPSATANIGYRHQFRSGLVAVLSVSDIFNSQQERSLVNSTTIIEDSTRRSGRRTVSFAISLPFGGARTPSPSTFDYDN